MALDMHTLMVPNGSNQAWTDRLVVGVQSGVAITTGTSPTQVVTFDYELPANYAVLINPGQTGVSWFVTKTNKLANSFTINWVGTVLAGFFDVVVIG